MPYLHADEINTSLSTFATTYASFCTLLTFPPTHGGRSVNYLKIAGGTTSNRLAALVQGGVHAREWAPPDAVLSFTGKLLEAYDHHRAIVYPSFTDNTAAPPITYGSFTIPRGDIRRIVEHLDLYVVPLVNPDGREFSFTPGNDMWRKNRRPPAAPGGCFGVDINRNFDIAWDFDIYFSPAGATDDDASKDPCDLEVYIGPGPLAASEPETQHVQDLITGAPIRYFIDVHSFGRKVLYPWGINDDQSADPTMNFRNHDWDRGGSHGGRDGLGGAYGEYFPDNPPKRLMHNHILIANRMRQAILRSAGAGSRARARSTYQVEQSIGPGLVPGRPPLATGAADDYTFSRQFLAAGLPAVYAFTLECGIDSGADPGDVEQGFQPAYATKYPKIEREVHSAIFGFLSYVASHTP